MCSFKILDSSYLSVLQSPSLFTYAGLQNRSRLRKPPLGTNDKSFQGSCLLADLLDCCGFVGWPSGLLPLQWEDFLLFAKKSILHSTLGLRAQSHREKRASPSRAAHHFSSHFPLADFPRYCRTARKYSSHLVSHKPSLQRE